MVARGASGKTEKQLLDLSRKSTSAFLELMNKTHPGWGVTKAMNSQAIKTKFAKALDKNAHGWIDSAWVNEMVDMALYNGPAKSGKNKGKILAVNNKWSKKSKDVWTAPTKTAVKAAITKDIAAARKWTVDRAKIKGLKFWDWSTWAAYWDYWYGGSTDIFGTAGINGYEKNTLLDLTNAMIDADLAGRVTRPAVFRAYGLKTTTAKPPAKPSAKPKARSSSRSAKKPSMATKKSSKRSTNVSKRKGPSVSANSVKAGTRKRGNDGKMWTSKRMPKGHNRWVRGAESQVTWQDDSGLSSASAPPSDVFMADGDGFDLEVSLENPIRDGAYVAVGLGLGTLALGVGLTALSTVLGRLSGKSE